MVIELEFRRICCLWSRKHKFCSVHELLPAGNHHGRSHPWQRSCGEDLTGKGGSGLEGFPGPARAPTQKPKSVCLLFTILCLSTTLLILAGGYPQPTFSGENQLRALNWQLSWAWKEYFYSNPCRHSSLLDRFFLTLTTNAHDCSQLPNHERHGKPKHSKSPNGHRAL